MKSTFAAVLVCATMLAAGQPASAADLCRCWQENMSVRLLGLRLLVSLPGGGAAYSNPNRKESNCHTRCACPGLRIKGIVSGSTACAGRWCLSGAGGVVNGDGTVSLLAGGMLSKRDQRGYPEVLAVGSGACDAGAGPSFEPDVCQCRQVALKTDSPGSSTCRTRCRCRGVRGGLGDTAGALGDGEGWRILGRGEAVAPGGFFHSGHVYLSAGSELRKVDRRGIPTVLAVGSDVCP